MGDLICEMCRSVVQAKQICATSDGRGICQDCADVLCRFCGERTIEVELWNGDSACRECANTSDGYDRESDKYWA